MKQCDCLLHVIFLPYIKAYPACLRQNMMRLCAPGSDELIAHFFRKWNIDEMIPMDMPDLPFADHIFHAAEAMRLNRHTRPRCDCLCDGILCAAHAHSDSFPLPSFLQSTPSVCCSLAERTLNISTKAAT